MPACVATYTCGLLIKIIIHKNQNNLTRSVACHDLYVIMVLVAVHGSVLPLSVVVLVSSILSSKSEPPLNGWHTRQDIADINFISLAEHCLRYEVGELYSLHACKNIISKVFVYYSCVTIFSMEILRMQYWKQFYSPPTKCFTSTRFFELA